MEDKNYTTFIDNAGRAIFTEVTEETDETLVAKNPVMISVQQGENGQMAVQLFPLFFQEFVQPNDESRANYFKYAKNNIALGTGFQIESRIADQYEKIVNPQLVPVNNANAGNTKEEPEVIKLFDE
tara:strand:- start:205 stop:582 length:378 start_codon:yes stop_codon:yes gene_type:complete